MAQASEIGLGLLSRASSFWKEGKERVQILQKVHVEHSTALSSTAAVLGVGRPKWTQAGAGGGGDDGEEWTDVRREESIFSDETS